MAALAQLSADLVWVSVQLCGMGFCCNFCFGCGTKWTFRTDHIEMAHGCCFSARDMIPLHNITDIGYAKPCNCCCCLPCCQKGTLNIYAKPTHSPGGYVPLTSTRAREVKDRLRPVVEANARGDIVRINVMP
jgi:hypothetical protein